MLQVGTLVAYDFLADVPDALIQVRVLRERLEIYVVAAVDVRRGGARGMVEMDDFAARMRKRCDEEKYDAQDQVEAKRRQVSDAPARDELLGESPRFEP